MTLPANIRVNVSAPFPTLVQAIGPVAISKQNGIWTVSLDPSQVGAFGLTPAQYPSTFVTVWNSGTKAFYNVALTQLLTGLILPGRIRFVLTGVDFNTANTDTQLLLTNLPTTRYRVDSVRLCNASHSLTTATVGLFTAAAAGGVAIASLQAITVSATADATNNNAMKLTLNNPDTISFTTTTLFLRVGTAEGAAATGDVVIDLEPLT